MIEDFSTQFLGDSRWELELLITVEYLTSMTIWLLFATVQKVTFLQNRAIQWNKLL